MKLKSRAFDGVWILGATLGALALAWTHSPNVILHRAGILTLACGLAISLFLSLFVERAGQQEDVAPKTFQIEPEEMIHRYLPERPQMFDTDEQQGPPIIYVHPHRQLNFVYVKGIQKTQHWHHINARAYWPHLQEINRKRDEMAQKLEESQAQVRELAGTLQDYLTAIQTVSKRRNIAAEASAIALKLKGTGVEVVVCPNDDIVIRTGDDTSQWPENLFTQRAEGFLN